MAKYEDHVVWCNMCRTKVPFTVGERNLCPACHKKYHGNTKTLTAMEQSILEKEDEIANLQTIINLMEDMRRKIDEHKMMIATTD